MIGGDDAFLIFIAIFWGVMLGSVGRYQPFDTAAAFFAPKRHPRRIRAQRRFWVSMLVLNVLPLAYLSAGYLVLRDTRGIPALLGAAVMSLGLFGCPRVLHAIVATRRTRACFLPMRHWRQQIAGERHANEHTLRAHLLPGLVFLFGYFALGALLARF